MRRALVFLLTICLFALWGAGSAAQELVVFTNDTAMVIKGHSEKGGYVFLTLAEGQIAVPKARVKEITKFELLNRGQRGDEPAPGLKVRPDMGKVHVEVKDGRRDGLRSPMGKRPGLARPAAAGQDKGEDAEEDDADNDAGSDEGDDEAGDDDVEAPPEPEPQPAAPERPPQVAKPAVSTPVLQRR